MDNFEGYIQKIRGTFDNTLPEPHKVRLYLPKYLDPKNNLDVAADIGKVSEKNMAALEKLLRGEAVAQNNLPQGDVANQGQALIEADAQAQAKKALSPAENFVRSNQLKTVTAHYNPNSLTFRGLGGHNIKMSAGLGSMAENQLSQTIVDISTTLSCQLVFADINLEDAFMYNRIEGGGAWMLMEAVAAATKAIASAVSSKAAAFFNKSHSIQKYVDGLIATLVNEYSRNCIFAWGNNIFKGQITSVNGQYKMFNTRGEPILATVDLEIRQNSSTQDQYVDDEYWRKKFTKVFEADESSVADAVIELQDLQSQAQEAGQAVGGGN